MIPELPKSAYSCGQHGPVTAWFRLARPGNVIPVTKILLCWEEYIVYRNGTAFIAAKCCVLLKFYFVKN
jgi:hypothetical protein